MSKLVLEKSSMLPEKWIETSLDQISDIILGQSPPSNTYNKEKDGLPFFQGKSEFGKLYPTPKIWCNKPKKLAEKNDVLLSVRAPVGTTNLCPEKSCIGRGLAAIRPKGDIPILFVLYFLRHIEHDLERQGTGTTFKAISGNQIRSITIPLPPLNEQKRIVAKIEEDFTMLDISSEEVKKNRLLLIQYKKSLLHDTFNGRLTQEWRERNSDMPTGSSIIEKSLKLRETIYKNLNSKYMKKYHEPSKPKLIDLPVIPYSWEWASFEQISEKVTVGYVGTMKKEYVNSGIPFLRSQNVRANRFDSEGLKFITKDFHKKLSKSKLSSGDIVVVRSGDVGTSCVIPQDLQDSNCSDVLIIKNPLVINSHFGAYYLNSIKDSRVQREKVGIALTHFNTESLAKLAIPVPPEEEQKVIVKELERKFSFINEIEIILDGIIKYHVNLKNKILEYAFQGKLVSQDPNDESAEVLLQKIKQEKEKLQETQKISKVKSFKSRRMKNAK